MSEYCHGSHTVFSIHLHLVWITKYRHKVLKEVAERVRTIVREGCRKSGVLRLFPALAPQYADCAPKQISPVSFSASPISTVWRPQPNTLSVSMKSQHIAPIEVK